jgi:AAA15 family ATPase/GTPase
MIEEIAIKNFKSIQKATIRLRNVNILIGANNSGKSNFLDALALYQRMLVMELSDS